MAANRSVVLQGQVTNGAFVNTDNVVTVFSSLSGVTDVTTSQPWGESGMVEYDMQLDDTIINPNIIVMVFTMLGYFINGISVNNI